MNSYLDKEATDIGPEPDFTEHAVKELIELLNSDMLSRDQLARLESALYSAKTVNSVRRFENMTAAGI